MLVSLSLLAFAAGCTAAAGNGNGNDSTDGTSSALMNDSNLVGKYYDRSVPAGGIAKLTLSADGHFDASVDAAGTAKCITAPCLLPLSGTWTSSTDDGAVRLSLDIPGAAARVYEVNKYEGQLTITGADGQVEHLTMLDADQCIIDSDCNAANNEVCAPKVCAMLCAESSPFCCGASVCQAKSAN
jgi:hypothetical protein